MNFFMSLQMTCLVKKEATDKTAMFLLPRMDPNVTANTALMGKYLSTVLTLIFLKVHSTNSSDTI